ncbi:acyltransferase [Adhaeribacter arboris]|uniref:Acyltransferase n=1 Tax=Adhaeribacter arboris TaxID=2072846 RepID=A0A2T2YA30_9BACT|nr:acyltransferase [Adhaeribacter arboris]PSR52375.1 acyltransferase [Adhaeribacter arboris]
MIQNSNSTFIDSKKHLLILDALRGLAAIMVVTMHTFELFCEGDYHKLFINHGYLAVDFFFMLSGYVMAHAYDDRWNKMTVVDFCKRRLIRLHPLIILGMTFGALLFYSQASAVFPKIAGTPVWQLVMITGVGYSLIPIPPAMDIRGWNEMHPLNGPAWSLFFEYLANILHVFILRKLPNLVLSLFVFMAAVALFHLAITKTSGDLIGGWSLEPEQLRIGFTRLLFPYMAGMLLRRTVKIGSNKRTFLLTSALLVLVLSFPRVGGHEHLWLNGLYEALIIVLVFPLIIYLGAIGEVKGVRSQKVCTFLGDISYPLYITHFPFVCVYYAWITNNKTPLAQGALIGILLIIGAIALAYAALKMYDLPIRKWLARQFIYTKDKKLPPTRYLQKQGRKL